MTAAESIAREAIGPTLDFNAVNLTLGRTTILDNVTFLVRPNACAIPMNGSTWRVNTSSDSHSESMPAASSRSTVSPNAAGSLSGPRPTPMRTFIVAANHTWRPESPRRTLG